MMVKDPVSFCRLIGQDDYSSSSYQQRPEERREEEYFKDSSQKLHIPLSLIKPIDQSLVTWLHLATKMRNVVCILGGCEPI